LGTVIACNDIPSSELYFTVMSMTIELLE